ncbi:MAG: tRNA glutamyl-Q(34) synthetase GluQRS [Calditrichaeota bacterium]|nr:tRNA glutamyl-Q(34) synthetase GluQRS [Calditrichota bacterium]
MVGASGSIPDWNTLLASRPQGAVRGRLAPSPTGELHLGNAQSALGAWLSVRHRGGSLVLRIEDLDKDRVLPGGAQRCARDLEWLGLDWDEDDTLTGPCAPYQQTLRQDLYTSALIELSRRGRLFPCALSRQDLRQLASAPHAGEPGEPGGGDRRYPPHLRPDPLPAPGWFHGEFSGECNLRFLCEDRDDTWQDLLHGEQRDNAGRRCGDFVLRRRDGVFSYQLAAVVDDALMGITDVVRGSDLLDSCSRQLQLWEALGATPPVFAHLPLLRAGHGAKLSKRESDLELATLRRAGVRPATVLGWLGWSLGLLPAPRPIGAHDLLDVFDWSRITTEDRVVPPDLTTALAGQ